MSISDVYYFDSDFLWVWALYLATKLENKSAILGAI